MKTIKDNALLINTKRQSLPQMFSTDITSLTLLPSGSTRGLRVCMAHMAALVYKKVKVQKK